MSFLKAGWRMGGKWGLGLAGGLLVLGLSACSFSLPGASSPAVEAPTEAATVAASVTQMPGTTAAQATATAAPVAVLPVAALAVENERTAASDGMIQVLIPAGEFIMGTTEKDAQRSETNGVSYPELPEHRVTLDAFWIDKFEVTNAQYKLCSDAGACGLPFVNASFTHSEYFGNPEFDDYPVVYVDWWNARDYCAWAGRRLPSEAEWEKAARGTEGWKYPWGNEAVSGERANFCDKDCPRVHANIYLNDGYPDTAPVGSFPAGASVYGVMDLAGNVWEWTNTIPAPYPYDAQDGREDGAAYAQRIWRGGTWANGVWYLRATTRYHSVQKYRIHSLGFRCAQ